MVGYFSWHINTTTWNRFLEPSPKPITINDIKIEMGKRKPFEKKH